MNTITATIALISLAFALPGCTASNKPVQLAAAINCDAIPSDDGALKAFYATGGVVGAKVVKQRRFIARAIQPNETVGADVYAVAQPGVTEAYLERALACHAARRTPAHMNDPLVPTRGHIAKLDVSSSNGRLAVRIIGDSSKTGSEIWNRARSFSARGTVAVEQVAALSIGAQ